MISASRDGGLLAEILNRFQITAVRGSSSRRGKQALLEARRWIEKGRDVAITPDGPRGPRYVAKDGAVSLSLVTGAPIVPVRIRIVRKIQLRSWDRFQIPLPISRCHLHFCAPISVPREATAEDREAALRALNQALGDSD